MIYVCFGFSNSRSTFSASSFSLMMLLFVLMFVLMKLNFFVSSVLFCDLFSV